VLITALRDVGDHGDFSFSRLPNYPITKSHGSPRSSSPLPFRALPEHPRRRERNPEDVCRVNAASGNFLDKPLCVPSCPLWLKCLTFRSHSCVNIPTLAMRDCHSERSRSARDGEVEEPMHLVCWNNKPLESDANASRLKPLDLPILANCLLQRRRRGTAVGQGFNPA
jgi:hypothetical protein